jgi:hypothetical protein
MYFMALQKWLYRSCYLCSQVWMLGYQVIPKTGYGVRAKQLLALLPAPQPKYSRGHTPLLYTSVIIRLHHSTP